jgi:hypothetical protein
MVANHLWRAVPARDRLKDHLAYKAICLILMTLFIMATWVFFRAPDLQTAQDVFSGLTRFAAPTLLTPFLGALIVIGVGTQFLPSAWRGGMHGGLIRLAPVWHFLGFGLALVALMLLAPSAAAPFIYFQF